MKKELTPTQKKKRYKRISRLCVGGEFVSTLAPFVAMAIANRDTWFVEIEGWRMSLASFLALAVMGIAIWLITKKKMSMSYATLLVGWFTATWIVILIGKIVNDLGMIMAYGFIGLCGAAGLEIGNKQATKKAEKIQKAIDRAEEDMEVDAYKQELEERKIKVKVKK